MMRERMKRELETKKDLLRKNQEYFLALVELEINSSNFENNSINLLLYLKELKVEIAQLELNLSFVEEE